MKFPTPMRGIVIVCAMCTAAACTQGNGASAVPANAAGWVANGARACDEYLTPEFVGAIFKSPAGHSKKLSAQACSFETPDFASISITLAAAGPAAFAAHRQYLGDPVPLSGVGDKAVRTDTGIEAIKGNDRMCDIDVMPPFGNKLKGEALARKLGELCNKLFALP